MGIHVRVVEIDGRRCRIDEPVPGWVSFRTTAGQTILEEAEVKRGPEGEVIIPPRKATLIE